jgi:RimJ/RimL family protein N-acetyltransferase
MISVSNTRKVKIRKMEPAEYQLLDDFLYMSLFVMEGQETLPRSTTSSPHIAKYISGFGKPGDCCYAAEADGIVQGAAWSRLFPDDGRGYGYVDSTTPEISISVHEKYRGRGIGTALICALIDELFRQGYEKASLSVQKGNEKAFGLYQKLGFEVVSDMDESVVMLKKSNKITRH